MQQLAGRFIVFDGPDGSGKTTQFGRFAQACRAAGLEVCEVREPGGTAIGEQIRSILLNPENEAMSLRSEMMLYMASRAQLVEERIRPALEQRAIVLADRFISSTLAYQGTAGGLPHEEILAVGRVAVGQLWPDLTVIFDVDEKSAQARMMGKPKSASATMGASLFADLQEARGIDYQRRVRQGYLDQARAQPDRYCVIDASPDAEQVFEALMTALAARFGD
jgi:dTMP kinase